MVVKPNLRSWRYFDATDFVSLIKPSLSLLHLYGLIPCTIDRNQLKKSRIARLYCLLITTVYCLATLFILYIINASSYSDRVTTWKLQGNCFYTLANFTVISNLIFGGPIVKVLRDLAAASSKLPSETFKRIARWMHSKDLISYFLLAVHTPKVFFGDKFTIFIKLVSAYSAASTFLLDFQYENYVLIIANCFKQVNKELLMLKESVLTERAHLLRRLYHDQFNPVLFEKLRYLKHWHYDLNEVIRKINSTFSLQMISTVIATFTEITFGLYFYITTTLGKTDRTVEKEIWYFYYFTLVIYYTLKLFLITLTCQWANDENYRTRSIINEILINTDDKPFKEELHLFSLQLFHSNSTFVAKGVKLDATLLTAMSKGIFTYLLILIQFLITTQTI